MLVLIKNTTTKNISKIYTQKEMKRESKWPTTKDQPIITEIRNGGYEEQKSTRQV